MGFVLQLKVPPLQLDHLEPCAATPAAFKQWLDALPQTNLGELSKQLSELFIQFNQLKIGPAKRLELLELLRPQTYFILKRLGQIYQSNSLEMDRQQRRAANLAQALQNHLAAGYKHVLLGALASGHKQLQLTSLHRALTELGLTQLRASYLHCPATPKLWLELHQLFQLGLRQKLLGETVADPCQPKTGAALTALNLYKRALLFGLCNSNHLRKSEQQKVFSACARLSVHTVLNTAADQALFALDPECDQPPRYRSSFNVKEDKTLWLLDTQPVCRILERRRNELSDLLDDSLVQHLLRAWGNLTERRHKRAPASGRIQFCLGFCASHYYLAGRHRFDDWLDDQELDWRDRYQHQLTRGAAWNQAFDAEAEQQPLAHADEALDYAAGEGQPDPFALFEAERINKSKGGYSLRLTGQLPPRLLSGELLALKTDADAEQPWRLGIIRWLKREGARSIQAGIQLLPANARLGAVAVRGNSGEYSHYLRCFQLPGIAAAGQEKCLLLPRTRFNTEKPIRLIDGGKARSGMLDQLLEQSGSLSLFSFTASQEQVEYGLTLELEPMR